MGLGAMTLQQFLRDVRKKRLQKRKARKAEPDGHREPPDHLPPPLAGQDDLFSSREAAKPRGAARSDSAAAIRQPNAKRYPSAEQHAPKTPSASIATKKVRRIAWRFTMRPMAPKTRQT